MKKDRDTVEMFPELPADKVRPETDQQKYDKLIIEKYQTNLFKSTGGK